MSGLSMYCPECAETQADGKIIKHRLRIRVAKHIFATARTATAYCTNPACYFVFQITAQITKSQTPTWVVDMPPKKPRSIQRRTTGLVMFCPECSRTQPNGKVTPSILQFRSSNDVTPTARISAAYCPNKECCFQCEVIAEITKSFKPPWVENMQTRNRTTRDNQNHQEIEPCL